MGRTASGACVDTGRIKIIKETKLLENSMHHSSIRKDPELARQFLSFLSMYNSNGTLKKR